ncbi:hypothetical protein FQA39_LY15195 [Lamprigera yunnana]|nr:hypothetical protein FQA39_LY15195 [Lamprigera yunnana]
MFDVKSKIALVTGAARGIGLAHVKELLRDGIRGVSMVDILGEEGTEALEELRKEYGRDRVIFYECDITKSDKLKDVFKTSFEHWGGLDILSNSAGTAIEQNWDKVILLNCCATVTATFLGFEYMSKLKKGHGGVIVNISSIAALYPNYLVPTYSGTKSFIAAFGCALGTDRYYEHNQIRIMTVCPGATETTLISSFIEYSLDDICPNIQQSYAAEVGEYVMQSPEHVAKSVVTLIAEANNGSIWVIKNGKPPLCVEYGKYPDFSS